MYTLNSELSENHDYKIYFDYNNLNKDDVYAVVHDVSNTSS